MRHASLIFLCAILFCELKTQAENLDVDCLPARAWDTGFQVRMIKQTDGHYDAALDQLAISGRKPRYRGKVDLSKVSVEVSASDCLVKALGTTEKGLPFELQIPLGARSELISVDNKPVQDRVREMSCHFSDQFIADQKAICEGTKL